MSRCSLIIMSCISLDQLNVAETYVKQAYKTKAIDHYEYTELNRYLTIRRTKFYYDILLGV